MKRALQIQEEIKTIDGCQKLINVWQFRMRWLYFEIRGIGKPYYDILSTIINKETLEIESNKIYDSLNENDRNKLNRLAQLILISSILQERITDISKIQTKLILNHFGEYGTTPDLLHPYGGFLGKKSIDECENKELIY